MERHLDRKVAEKRVYPAINVNVQAHAGKTCSRQKSCSACGFCANCSMEDVQATEFILDKLKIPKPSEFFNAMKRK